MKIGRTTTNPGELRTKIVLEERKLEKDAGGFVKPITGRQIQTWCRWTNAHGQELWQADAAGARKTATLLIRYQPDLDETWKVIYRGNTWEIHSIDNVRERDEYQELRIAMIGAG
mgnify:CR=1 FL=1|jgi:SPP1 family predicted phage head-tail adaptor